MKNGSTTNERVLLIDDDDLVAGSLRDYLVRGGSCVDVAPEPLVANRLMHAQKYGVIIVDPYLTGGVEHDDAALLSGIRELQPDAALIILTGYASPALRVIAGRERATAILTKPQPVSYLSQFVVDAAQGNSPQIKGQIE
jgi:two-component system response regulator RegA